MKLIKGEACIIHQSSGIEGMYKMIELAGRVSHKSEDKIVDGSAKTFVDRMINLGHGACLEFGTVYLKIDEKLDPYIKDVNNLTALFFNPYTRAYSEDKTDTIYITTNYRVLVENNWLDLLKYWSEPTEYHPKRVCTHWICDRGVSHELVRHRTLSFLQESTRYCNYSKGKFNNEITCITPSWLDTKVYSTYTGLFIQGLTFFEEVYFDLMKQWNEKTPDNRYKSGYKNNPLTPQQARQVLPNALKTELYVSGFVDETGWKNFFKLRDDKQHAHPDMYALAHKLHQDFIDNGFIEK